MQLPARLLRGSAYTTSRAARTSGLNRIPASASLLVLSEYAGAASLLFDTFDMRKSLPLQDVSSERLESVEKDVNACLEHLGYELYGSPFSCGDNYMQALVKSEDVSATDVPSTLRRPEEGHA
jgi:hypothetical protein